HVAQITATTLFSVGSGGLGGREWIQPLIDACGGPVEQYALSHEGATDHDWLDAWMAQQLGSEPKPRLWQVASPRPALMFAAHLATTFALAFVFVDRVPCAKRLRFIRL